MPMSVMRELRRRLSAEQSGPRFDPCLPRSANQPPVGGWLHEIKHDGFRIMAHRRGRSVRLVTRNGHDLADRFPLAAEAIEALPIRSCVIDGEAIVCDESKLWPLSAQALGNRIDRVAPLLRNKGFLIERKHSGQRHIIIRPPANADPS